MGAIPQDEGSQCFAPTLVLGAPPMLVVTPRSRKQLIQITCAFGLATVFISFRAGPSCITALPAANTWEWILDPGEGLYAQATGATTVLSGVKKDID